MYHNATTIVWYSCLRCHLEQQTSRPVRPTIKTLPRFYIKWPSPASALRSQHTSAPSSRTRRITLVPHEDVLASHEYVRFSGTRHITLVPHEDAPTSHESVRSSGTSHITLVPHEDAPTSHNRGQLQLGEAYGSELAHSSHVSDESQLDAPSGLQERHSTAADNVSTTLGNEGVRGARGRQPIFPGRRVRLMRRRGSISNLKGERFSASSPPGFPQKHPRNLSDGVAAKVSYDEISDPTTAYASWTTAFGTMVRGRVTTAPNKTDPVEVGVRNIPKPLSITRPNIDTEGTSSLTKPLRKIAADARKGTAVRRKPAHTTVKRTAEGPVRDGLVAVEASPLPEGESANPSSPVNVDPLPATSSSSSDKGSCLTNNQEIVRLIKKHKHTHYHKSLSQCSTPEEIEGVVDQALGDGSGAEQLQWPYEALREALYRCIKEKRYPSQTVHRVAETVIGRLAAAGVNIDNKSIILTLKYAARSGNPIAVRRWLSICLTRGIKLTSEEFGSVAHKLTPSSHWHAGVEGALLGEHISSGPARQEHAYLKRFLDPRDFYMMDRWLRLLARNRASEDVLMREYRLYAGPRCRRKALARNLFIYLVDCGYRHLAVQVMQEHGQEMIFHRLPRHVRALYKDLSNGASQLMDATDHSIKMTLHQSQQQGHSARRTLASLRLAKASVRRSGKEVHASAHRLIMEYAIHAKAAQSFLAAYKAYFKVVPHMTINTRKFLTQTFHYLSNVWDNQSLRRLVVGPLSSRQSISQPDNQNSLQACTNPNDLQAVGFLFSMLGYVGTADEMWRAWLAFFQSSQYMKLDSIRKSSKDRFFIKKTGELDTHIAWRILNMTEVEFLSLPMRSQRQLLLAPEWPTSDPEERSKLTARHLDILVELENALNMKWNGEAYENDDEHARSTGLLYASLAQEGKLANVLLQYPEIKEVLAKMTFLPASVRSYARLTDPELAAKVQGNAPPADDSSKPVTSDFVSFAESSPGPQHAGSGEASLSTTVLKSVVSSAPDDSSSIVRLVQTDPPLNSIVPSKGDDPSTTTNDSARARRPVSFQPPNRLRMQRASSPRVFRPLLTLPPSWPRSSTRSRGGGENTDNSKAATPASSEEHMDLHILGV